jgi:hypothetical protein
VRLREWKEREEEGKNEGDVSWTVGLFPFAQQNDTHKQQYAKPV